MSIRVIILFLVLNLFHQIGFTQYDTTWIKTYGGNRDDISRDFIQTHDSGFLSIGSTSSFGFNNAQMYFLKLDSNGAIQWTKSHGGPGQDWGNAVIQTSDNGFLGVGYSNSYGAGGFDLYLVKLDSNGDLEYEKYYGGVDWDFAWDVIEYRPGEFYIVGETQSFGTGNTDGWIVQFDEPTQNFTWDTTYGDIGPDGLRAISQFRNGTLSCTGYYTNTGETQSDLLYLNFSPNTHSTNTLLTLGDTLNDGGNDITLFSDSTVMITGYTYRNDTSRTYTLRIDDQNNILRHEIWSLGDYAEGKSVVERPDGYAAIFSSTHFASMGYEFWFYFMDTYGSGTAGSLQDDYASKMIISNRGYYMMTGYTEGFGATYPDILIYKTDTGNYDPNNFYKIEDGQNIVSVSPAQNVDGTIEINFNNDFLNIQQHSSKSDILHVFITNVLGQNILFRKTTDSYLVIPTSQLNKGSYFCTILLNNGRRITKQFTVL
ncbi:T9SS type A sorting domain-containing protein [bacterium SCSIO 12643]|nr:T9SS type A sorting domain-containing protein [bacterium SCSIO 12643]